MKLKGEDKRTLNQSILKEIGMITDLPQLNNNIHHS
jgi:hypothetical protein